MKRKQMRRAFCAPVILSLFCSTSVVASTLNMTVFEGVANGDFIPETPLPATVAEATTVLDRFTEPAYEDGFGSPAELGRPSPRVLSNTLSVPENRQVDPAPLSNLAVAFGQLMASHEIARSPTDPNESIAVPVSPDDPVAVDQDGVPVMPQSRSRFEGGTGVGDPRQQLNDVSKAFDGSTVYGSDQATETMLRTLDGTGKLLTDADGGLPIIDGRRRAGDVRADENKALEALHVLFVHEHNRLADEIAAGCSANGLDCSGEEIFQGAKAIVAATQEKIFYDEFLPIFLGTDDLGGLVPDQTLLSRDPAMLNEFSTTAGRVGHTQVPDILLAGLPSGPLQSAAIEDCLFSETCLEGASLDEILYGSSVLQAEAIDLVVTDGLRHGQIPGFADTIIVDLLATNINRGRDHGIVSYGELRAALGFDLTDETALLPDYVLDAYAGAPVDPLVGLFAETRGAGDYLGETGKALWGLQFSLLQSTDGLLFDDAYAGLFEDMTLASLIASNTVLEASDFGVSAFLAPVPLPAAGWGLLAGLAGFGMIRRRQRRATASS